MRYCFFLFLLILVNIGFGQFSDDFSDGDFTSSPVWVGDTDEFVIDGGQLRSNGPASSDVLHLAVESVAINDATWEFLIQLDFAPSASNQVKVYLVSNQSDLESPLNGYFIEMGQSGNDQIRFYRQDGSTDDLLFTGTSEFSSKVTVKLRITRDDAGMWEVFSDPSGGNTFASEGSSFTDNTYTSSEYFGVVAVHTRTRNDLFYFDDFEVTGTASVDNDPPIITSLKVLSEVAIQLTFSEDVNETTAENAGNYSIDNDISISNATLDDAHLNVITLTTTSLVNGQTYILTINNVEDLNGNVIDIDSQERFQYLVFEEADAFDVVINEFMADPDPAIGLPNAEYVELYNNSTKYFNLENWTLDGHILPEFTLAPDNYVIVVEDDHETLFSSYSHVISTTTLSLNNVSDDEITLKDDGAAAIFSVNYTGSADGTSFELINPNGPDFSIDNYGLSEDPAGGTPGEQNSIFDDTPDTTAPEIVSVSSVSDTVVAIVFSEKVTEATAETTGNYALDNGINVTGVARDDSALNTVHLTVSALTSGVTYVVTINNVADLSGNAIAADSEASFFYVVFEEAEALDVVVNEFMADPVSVVGLPEAEYVELYNRSAKYFNLEEWTLDDRLMPSFTLVPGGYVIVVDDEDEALFEDYADVVSISSLSLSNSNDEVILSDSTGTTIFSCEYENPEEGIATELINPEGPDYSSANYGLSEDPAGGTPGERNSIFDDTPDTTAPEIVSVSSVSDTAVAIVFSEKVTEATAETTGNYALDNGINVTGVARDDSALNTVHLTVSALTSGVTYVVTINNVADLSGNAIAADSEASFFYVVFEEAEALDVVVNEFMADPVSVVGLPEAEYVELYNRSAKYLNLEEWTLDDRLMPSFTLVPGGYVIVVDDEDEALFEDYADVVSISSLSLSNSNDEVILSDSTGTTIFSCEYENPEEGIATELINPEGPDYSSANYGLSEDPAGGTPGEQNSIFDDTPDTAAPLIESIALISATQLTLHFSEFLEESSAEDLGHYAIDGAISVLTATLDIDDLAMVHLEMEELTSLKEYTLTVNGVEDLSGNTIANGTATFQYVATEEVAFGDVVINEFMADPTPASLFPEGDFVEILNISDKYCR